MCLRKLFIHYDCMKYSQIRSPGASRVHGLLRGGVPGNINVSGVGQPSLPPLILKIFTGKALTKISKTCRIVGWLLPLSNLELASVLLSASLSSDIPSLTAQMDALLKMKLLGMSWWKRNFPWCRVHCRASRMGISYEGLQISCVL